VGELLSKETSSRSPATLAIAESRARKESALIRMGADANNNVTSIGGSRVTFTDYPLPALLASGDVSLREVGASHGYTGSEG